MMVDGKVVGGLLLSRSARALFKGLYEDRGKIAIGIAAILPVLIVLSGVLSRGIARPIEALGAAPRSVAAGRGRGAEPPGSEERRGGKDGVETRRSRWAPYQLNKNQSNRLQ